MRPDRGARLQPDVRDDRRPGQGVRRRRPTCAPRPPRASSSTSRTSCSSRARSRRSGSPRSARPSATRSRPGNFIFRTREFEQMEMEFFVPPDDAAALVRALAGGARALVRGARASTRPPAPARARRRRALALLERDERRRVPVPDRLVGARGDRQPRRLRPDASTPSSPARSSSTSTRRPASATCPHVIEPAAGADRATLAFLVDAYDEEGRARGRGRGRARTVLRLHPRLAPVKVGGAAARASKDGQPELAREVYRALRDGGIAGRVRRRRRDRQALPAPGRDRHAVVP